MIGEWESPVKIIESDIQMQMEGNIMTAIREVGIVVDKEELIKVIRYDKDQFDKGRAIGRAEAIDEYTEWLRKRHANFDEEYAEDIESEYLEWLKEKKE